VPAFGASGAISGVFAAYILLYPRRKIYFLVIIWPLKIRAIWYGLGWMTLQLLYSLSGAHGVASWAHVGGFLAGLVLVETYLKYEHLHSPASSV
jgi:membrane associated rhomboid family serine protease